MAALSPANQGRALQVIILGLIFAVAFFTRLFSVIRFESVIHEFDPWFNYRTTQKLVKDGLYEFWNWFDERSWYPLGRVVGGTVFPGLMVTAGAIHSLLHKLNFPVDIRNICVFLAPLFSTLTSFSVYLLTKEMHSASAGLLAAGFIAIAPGYISRSVAGSYDNEGIAIFLLMYTFYLWIKAVKLGSMWYGALAAVFYFYMVAAWGGYVFITNLIPLHAFALMVMGRFGPRLYVSYTTWYALGTLASMQVPFVGFQPIFTSEHMAAMGVFGLMQLVGFTLFLRSHLSSNHFTLLFRAFIGLVALVLAGLLAYLGAKGVIAPFAGRFYSLWDTGYAKKYIPIIASVSEHQPTTWASFFFDLQLLVFLFPAGVYLCFRQLRDEHVFVVLYAVCSSYFAGVMVRLMLTLTPIVCVAAGVAVAELMRTFSAGVGVFEPTVAVAFSTNKGSKATASGSGGGVRVRAWELKYLVALPFMAMLTVFAIHCTWVTSNAYSSPSIVMSSRSHDGSQVIIDDFREAYYWLRKNTADDAKVMAWWDYGYQLAGMANRTTLVDNNTWNNTHIATVGRAMASNEDAAYEIMQRLDVDYVLVIFGGLIGYSGDDINKFLWMIRIGEGVFPDHISEGKFFTPRGEYRVDDQAPPTMRNSVLYKLSYYRFNEVFGTTAYDRVRGTQIQSKPIKLHTMDEAFTTENWIVRIYKVRKPDFLGRSLRDASGFDEGRKRRRRAKQRSRAAAGKA
ncbi:Oligosaccharyl transferase STT3 subunit-domain-containing protein [Catenaria anguillulae PL171]|uniref:Dolichyl-diphosphooligosaccharide--protein glycosyltransferase subunit STT3 n=1 Tax=Catenaria anguillulae PL171 TaxID=765915 RepID=A0A1Y2I1G2_9FUNG|nr:Oligosaccharyl transferase STT3 subunit-domain-containing protein [Catenaria anguillulae PL171]